MSHMATFRTVVAQCLHGLAQTYLGAVVDLQAWELAGNHLKELVAVHGV